MSTILLKIKNTSVTGLQWVKGREREELKKERKARSRSPRALYASKRTLVFIASTVRCQQRAVAWLTL